MSKPTYNTVPRMNTDDCLDTLYSIGKGWQGQGCAVEVGCWLGATSIFLLSGLLEAGYNKPFYAFDRWIANEQQIREGEGVVKFIGQDLRDLYFKNVSSVYTDIKTYQGNAPSTLKASYRPEFKIEVCIFDAPKTEPIFTECIKALHEYWISGVTILCLLDHSFYERKEGAEREKLLAPVNFMIRNEGCFTMIHHKEGESAAFFRYEKPLINI